MLISCIRTCAFVNIKDLIIGGLATACISEGYDIPYVVYVVELILQLKYHNQIGNLWLKDLICASPIEMVG